MKMKIVAGLIVAFMVRLSLAAAMYTNEVNGVKWIYAVNDDGESAVIAGVDYSTISERMTVPDRVDDLMVTALGESVFAYCHDVREIVLPDSVEHIGAHAFYACNNLAHVNLPARLETVGSAAFQWSGLTGSIFVPDATTNIAAHAFYNCDGMESISIPGTVCEIGAGAFALNYNLHEINVRQIAGAVNRFRSIDGAVYSYDVKTLVFCPGGKTSIYIPASVEAIDESCFAQDLNLENINVASGNAMFASVSGVLYTRDRTSLILCPARKTYLAIPSTVTNICDYALYGSGVESVTIPAKVCHIGECVFSACFYLESINVDSKNAWYKSIDGILYSKDGSVLVAAPGGRRNISVSGQTSEIGKFAFFTNGKIGDISFPGTIMKIMFEAFGYCYELREAVLPYGVRIIDAAAFLHCPELETATIPPSVDVIGRHAFAECGKLSDLTISRGIHEVGEYAFADCTALEMVTIPPSVDRMGTRAFVGCSNLWYVRAPLTMKDVIEENQVFADCADYLYIDYYDVLDCFVQCFAAPEQPEASGTATMSPSAGTMEFGTAVTLTAKVGNASTVFAYWTDDSGNIVGYSPTLKVFPEKDTNYSAVFRVKTKCEAPEFDVAESYLWADGGELLITVNDAAYPVKFSAKNLPTGLKIDSSTGVISGNPTKPGTDAVTVSATNASVKKPVTATFEIVVPNLTSELFTAAGLKSEESYVLQAGIAPDLKDVVSAVADGGWSLAVSGLPSGIKYDAKKGEFTGIASKEGLSTVYFTATRRSGKGAEKQIATATFEVVFPTVALDMSAWGDTSATNKCTVAGGGKFPFDKQVTIKATPDKGKVFMGWFDGEDAVVSQAASLSFTMPSNDVAYVAKFITTDEDKASIVAVADGWTLEPWVSKTETHALSTNIWCGVYIEWPVAASALSATTIKVSGLPAGLKFTDKPVTTKIGTGKNAVTVTNVLANTIYGAPTAASKIDAKTKSAKPSEVKLTVTTAGKSSQTYQIDTIVDALPSWAQGTFAGGWEPEDAATSGGTVSLTVDAKGKVSGKALGEGLTYTLAAPYYFAFALDENQTSNFLADVTASWSYKEGSKTIKTNEVVQLVVQDNIIGGYAAVEDWFDAYTANWKVEPWKALGKKFDKATMVYAILSDGTLSDDEKYDTVALGEAVTGRVTLKFAATGAVTIAGEFVTGAYNDKTKKYPTVKATGSATFVPVDDEHGAVFIYLTPKGLPPHTRCVTVPWPEE